MPAFTIDTENNITAFASLNELEERKGKPKHSAARRSWASRQIDDPPQVANPAYESKLSATPSGAVRLLEGDHRWPISLSKTTD